MNKPIIDPSTLSEEQREAIRGQYNHLQKLWEYYHKENAGLVANVFAGHLEAFEFIFGSEFFTNQKGE